MWFKVEKILCSGDEKEWSAKIRQSIYWNNPPSLQESILEGLMLKVYIEAKKKKKKPQQIHPIS